MKHFDLWVRSTFTVKTEAFSQRILTIQSVQFELIASQSVISMNNTIIAYNCLFGDVEGAGARELPGGSMTKPILLYRKPDNRALQRSERRLSAYGGKWTGELYLPCSVRLRIALYYRSISEVLKNTSILLLDLVDNERVYTN